MLKKLFGFDLGIASIGWAVVEFIDERYNFETGEVFEGDYNQGRVIKCGVRTFEKGETGDLKQNSLAAVRRQKRLARRTCRRKALRMQELKKLFVHYGLATEKDLLTIYNMHKEKADVWQLRSEALQRKLEKEELVRVLTHISKHRGYKSYGTDNSDDKGKIKEAISSNLAHVGNYQTVAQYIWHEKSCAGKYAARNKKDNYTNSIPRDEIRKELKLIFDQQEQYGYFSKKLFEQLYGSGQRDDDFDKEKAGLIFRHRPIAGIEKMLGKCLFEKDEYKACKKAPSAELYVLWSKLNNFKIDRGDGLYFELTQAEKEAIYELLLNQKEVSYSAIRKNVFSHLQQFNSSMI